MVEKWGQMHVAACLTAVLQKGFGPTSTFQLRQNGYRPTNHGSILPLSSPLNTQMSWRTGLGPVVRPCSRRSQKFAHHLVWKTSTCEVKFPIAACYFDFHIIIMYWGLATTYLNNYLKNVKTSCSERERRFAYMVRTKHYQSWQ